ncbi:unnamed protein product [Adineta ricciae]|uniref:Endonuclease/exonuclease/phosphatase domain-containing protein n=1 Tax=Adineta ricciae TaxID=249248 RepID=A0A815AY58_ADIRI|nr:unnamed protein product [Adineta ricciae]CAF1260465.1 unnamed protein product [Adineta ricciae]
MQSFKPYNRLPIWYYNANKHRWVPKDPTMAYYPETYQHTSLRVITYNIWFDTRYQPQRFHHLNLLLQHTNAQVICLQEMTRSVLQGLISQPWIQRRYLVSDIDGRTFVTSPDSYGVVMLIDKRLPVQQLMSIPFPSKLGRQLLLAEIQVGSELLAIGTVHLESMRRNEDTRSEQLQICQAIFDKYTKKRSRATCLLVGDFNFDYQWPENFDQMNILANWTDLWPRLNGLYDPGLTTLREARLDRMMFRSSRIIPIGIKIIGNQPIAHIPKANNLGTDILNVLSLGYVGPSVENVFLSDHFGLMADFDLRHV